MPVRVGINGFGRIGRNILRAAVEAAREDFARFCDLILTAGPQVLERIINRPIYPERVELRR